MAVSVMPAVKSLVTKSDAFRRYSYCRPMACTNNRSAVGFSAPLATVLAMFAISIKLAELVTFACAGMVCASASAWWCAVSSASYCNLTAHPPPVHRNTMMTASSISNESTRHVPALKVFGMLRRRQNALSVCRTPSTIHSRTRYKTFGYSDCSNCAD